MIKKLVLTLVASVGLGSTLSAAAVDLNQFQTDFTTLMNGIARDVAPTLRLGALSGDLQGDATIDHFSFTPLGFGFTAADGIARVLQPGAADWQFVLPLADLVNDNLGSNNFFERLMAYPATKTAIGFGWNTWDFTVSGTYFPQSLTALAVDAAESDSSGTLHKLKPQFSYGNLGFQVRKTIVADSGPTSWVPALSLGAGYHYTFFDMGVTLSSLSDLGLSATTVGENQTLDMSGPFHVTLSSHVFTTDLQLSKHLLFFTPYVKLTGAYQNSTFTGDADMTAVITDSSNPLNNSEQKITAKPSVTVSDFAFLFTSGLEINLFVTTFNVNVVGDLSRATFNVKSFTLDGIDANAFTVNTGFRFAF